MEYQPKTGAKCGCKRGVQRDNCPSCEGTGFMIDFARIRSGSLDVPDHDWRAGHEPEARHTCAKGHANCSTSGFGGFCTKELS